MTDWGGIVRVEILCYYSPPKFFMFKQKVTLHKWPTSQYLTPVVEQEMEEVEID